jgi:sugar O-acyltransferase (sialic acid O-acetyltransferase NeuD family)
MEDIAYSKNRIIIFGDGDLAKELISFGKFNNSEISLISKLDESNLDYSKIDKSSRIFLAYSNPKVKSKIAEKLETNNLLASSFIHNSVLIGSNANLGKGVIIFPYTIISNNSSIGDFSFINCSCNIGHHSKIGKFSSIMSNSSISGHCEIGNHNYIGTNANLIPNIKTKKNITIGAGSVVLKNLKKEGTYFGVPAKKIF